MRVTENSRRVNSLLGRQYDAEQNDTMKNKLPYSL